MTCEIPPSWMSVAFHFPNARNENENDFHFTPPISCTDETLEWVMKNRKFDSQLFQWLQLSSMTFSGTESEFYRYCWIWRRLLFDSIALWLIRNMSIVHSEMRRRLQSAFVHRQWRQSIRHINWCWTFCDAILCFRCWTFHRNHFVDSGLTKLFSTIVTTTLSKKNIFLRFFVLFLASRKIIYGHCLILNLWVI